MPAIVRNMRKDPMHDTIIACVEKVKSLLVGSLPPLSIDKSSPLKGGETLTPPKSNAGERPAVSNKSSSSTNDLSRSTNTSATVDGSLIRDNEFKGLTMDSESLVNAAISAEEDHASEQTAAQLKTSEDMDQDTIVITNCHSQSTKARTFKEISGSLQSKKNRSSQSIPANEQITAKSNTNSATVDTQSDINTDELLEDMLRFSQLPDDEVEPPDEEEPNTTPVTGNKRRRSIDVNHADIKEHSIPVSIFGRC